MSPHQTPARLKKKLVSIRVKIIFCIVFCSNLEIVFLFIVMLTLLTLRYNIVLKCLSKRNTSQFSLTSFIAIAEHVSGGNSTEDAGKFLRL